jgi:4-hydroxythreonine-4-phosphate dehydrogenase
VAAVAATEMTALGVQVLLVGDLGAVRSAAKLRGIDVERFAPIGDPSEALLRDSFAARRTIPVFDPLPGLALRDRVFGRPGRRAGAAQLAWIDTATDLVSTGLADALVTGPVSKDAIARSGASGARDFRGHTEHLAARLGALEVTMAFWSEALTVSLATTHLRLADVARNITPPAVARATYWTGRLVAELGGASALRTQRKQRPQRTQRTQRTPGRSSEAGSAGEATRDGERPMRIAVAALNPHAGEGGLLGDEEVRAIAPGIRLATTRLRRAGVRVTVDGPIPAETAFRRAVGGAYAAVIAMYHDQATIPMKLLGFGEAVNVSLGLPIIRTSVDHGTAYDLAGKGSADPRGMIEAMRLAVRLALSGSQSSRSPAGAT